MVKVPPELKPALEWLSQQIGRVFLFSLKFEPYGPSMVLQAIMISLITSLREKNPNVINILKEQIDIADEQMRAEGL